MVDQECINKSPETYSCSSPRTNPGDGCLSVRMGGILSAHKGVNGGNLVKRGEQATHQLAGIEGGVPGPPVLCQTHGSHSHSAPYGQPSSDLICQQEGGDKVTGPLRPSPQTVGMVSQEVINCGSQTPSRPPEHQSGLRESPTDGFQRLEIEQVSFQTDNPTDGPVQHRSLCDLSEHPAGKIFQLESRPQVSGSRCTSSILERSPPTLPFPSIFPDWSSSPKNQRSRSCSPGSSLLACPSLVSSSLRHDVRRPSTPPARSGPSLRSHRKSSPSTVTEPSEVSGMAHIRRSLQTQGTSGQAADLYCASWRVSTASSYSTCWHRWFRWCRSRQVNPSQAPVAEVIIFLTELFKEGKEYSTINSHRSAISAVHINQIGKDPILIRFMQGVFNSRPPRV